jgi:hypothetical protein
VRATRAARGRWDIVKGKARMKGPNRLTPKFSRRIAVWTPPKRRLRDFLRDVWRAFAIVLAFTMRKSFRDWRSARIQRRAAEWERRSRRQ